MLKNIINLMMSHSCDRSFILMTYPDHFINSIITVVHAVDLSARYEHPPNKSGSR